MPGIIRSRACPCNATVRAYIYLGLGDTTHAFAELERATDANELWSQSMAATDQIYDPIRNSPRFRRLLERVGLGPYLSLILKR